MPPCRHAQCMARAPTVWCTQGQTSSTFRHMLLLRLHRPPDHGRLLTSVHVACWQGRIIGWEAPGRNERRNDMHACPCNAEGRRHRHAPPLRPLCSTRQQVTRTTRPCQHRDDGRKADGRGGHARACMRARPRALSPFHVAMPIQTANGPSSPTPPPAAGTTLRSVPSVQQVVRANGRC